MEKAFGISAELVHATMDYQRAVLRSADDREILKIYSRICDLQTDLNEACAAEAAAEKTL